MKTEDVRHLCLCSVCGKLGDERLMLRVGPMECLAHDRCVFEQLGEGILNLPQGASEIHFKGSWAGYDAKTARRPE